MVQSSPYLRSLEPTPVDTALPRWQPCFGLLGWFSVLALVDNQWVEMDLATPPSGEVHARLTEPNSGFGRFEVKKGARVIHYGVRYYVMDKSGFKSVVINPDTGVYTAEGKGQARFRAVVGDRHFDQMLVCS